MEIRNLITFVQVAELGSFTKAARALDYSQSTVSFQIKQLETELDCLLFERINHTLILTQRGRELLDYAQKVMHLTDEFRQNMDGAGALHGQVHIVTPDSVCEAMVLESYAEFYRRYPNISVKFSTADTKEMFVMLDHNEADVVITLDEHVFRKDYVIAKESRMQTHFVVGPSSPLAKRKKLRMEDLLRQPFILTEKGMAYRGLLDDLLARRSMEISPALEISRTDIIMKLLEQGGAVSFLPDFVTRRRAQEGRLVLLDVEDMQIDVWQQLIYHRSKWISRSLRAFLDFVMESYFDRGTAE